MPQQNATGTSKMRGLQVGSVAREAMLLALTLVCGVVLVVLLIFASRLFLASDPLAGVGSRQSNWLLLAPMGAFTLTILAFNLLAEGLRRGR